MTKSPRDRVQDSLSGDDRESIAKYLDWIRSAILDYSQALRRTAVILVTAVAIFELVIYSKNQTIAVSSLVIARNSIVLLFLPALVAYLVFQIIAYQNRVVPLLNMYSETFKLWSSKGNENSLHTPLLGSAPLYWNPFTRFYKPDTVYRSDRIEIYGTGILMLGIVFGVIGFEAQAYYVLFMPKFSTILPWAVSLGVTAFCLAMGFATLVLSFDPQPAA